jgi:hypothetical protein
MEGFNWGFALLGILGIVMHVMAKVMEQDGRTLAALWEYVKLNNLTVLYSILAYIAIVALWQTEGFDLLGFAKGQLTGATVLIAYVSTSLFKTAVEIRTKSKDQP